MIRIRWIPVVLALALCCAGCIEQESKVSNEPIKVGVLLPMSGEMADRGIDCLNGINLAIDEINSDGGIRALNGANISLIIADTRGDPLIGKKEAERLIRDEGVVTLIGAYQSSVNIQVTQVAEMYKVPILINIGIADIITERGFQYTFRVAPKAGFYAETKVKFLSDLRNLTGREISRVAIIYENTGFGTAVSLDEREALRKAGFTITGDFPYSATDLSNLTRVIGAVLTTNPDAILETTYLNDSIIIKQTLDKMGSTIPLIDTAGGTISDEYIKRLGSQADGTYSVAEYSSSALEKNQIDERFYNRYGMSISGDSVYSYQSVMVLKDALERAGSKDKNKIRDAIATTNMVQGRYMVLPDERIIFNKEGQNIFTNLYITQIQNGTHVVVWPSEAASGTVMVHT